MACPTQQLPQLSPLRLPPAFLPTAWAGTASLLLPLGCCPPHELCLAWVCRAQQPGSQMSPPSDPAESKGHGSPDTSGALDTYRKCAFLSSVSSSGASVSLLCTRRVANVYDRFKVRHKLDVSFLSYHSPEPQPTVRVCLYCAHV